jgi:hypothetical protein
VTNSENAIVTTKTTEPTTDKATLATVTTLPVPLDKTVRRERLEKLEAVIKPRLRSFLEVGEALREIRDERLYEESEYGKTFEAYANKRFGLSRIYAYRHIWSAEIQAMLPNGNKLPSESVARALIPLKDEPEKLRETWERAQGWREHIPGAASSCRTAITAKVVAKEVARTLALAPQPSNGKASTARAIESESPRSDLLSALQALWDSSIGAHMRDGREIERAAIEELIDLLNELRNTIET